MNVTALAACGQAAENNTADTIQRIIAVTIFVPCTRVSCELFSEVALRNQPGGLKKRRHNPFSIKRVQSTFYEI
jgi:hypothetical protein